MSDAATATPLRRNSTIRSLSRLIFILRVLAPEYRILRKAFNGGAAKEAPLRFAAKLVELGPAFVKLGQILSTRPDLVSQSYVDALSRLQEHGPEVPFKTIDKRQPAFRSVSHLELRLHRRRLLAHRRWLEGPLLRTTTPCAGDDGGLRKHAASAIRRFRANHVRLLVAVADLTDARNVPVLVFRYTRLAHTEERQASIEFGATYERYAKDVPRYVPHILTLIGRMHRQT